LQQMQQLQPLQLQLHFGLSFSLDTQKRNLKFSWLPFFEALSSLCVGDMAGWSATATAIASTAASFPRIATG